MFEIELNSNAAQVADKLSRFSAEMLSAIAAAMDEQNVQTVSAVQRDRLNFPASGPTRADGLRHRTGGLFESPRNSAARIIGQSIESAIGSNVVYAGAHEYGVDRVVQVPAHRRRNAAFDRYRKHGRGFIKTQSGIPETVRAHSMHMHLPARAPFGNTLADRTQNYSDAISGAIVTTWNGGAS